MEIGKTIKALRVAKGINQEKMSGMVGITQTSMSKIETGDAKPSQRTLNKICEVLRIPEALVYFLSITEADVPRRKRKAYNEIFPKAKKLVEKMFI